MRGKQFAIDKEILIKLYIEEQKPMHTISKELKVSIGKVYNDLKKYGIKTRDQKETFTFKDHNQSKEVKEKISKVHKNKEVSDITRLKISKANYGRRYVRNKWNGHRKTRNDGYISVYKPGHPCSSKDGYILEHRLVMGEFLGRYLKSEEVVHHINFNKKDNRINNLMLFQSQGEHTRYHKKIKKEGSYY